MTTSTQQTVLALEELTCLRAVASGDVAGVDATQIEALVAKGMLVSGDRAGTTLTPAGHHALHVDQPGMLPGIDE
jgi:hypothetical protein